MSNETPSFVVSEAGGDQDFYAAYGLSLSLWSWVEHALCRVYLRLIPVPDFESLARSFFAIRGFGNKLQRVDTLVVSVLRKNDPHSSACPLVPDWKSIQDRLRNAVEDRNKLAHAGIWTSPGIGSYAHGSIWHVASLPTAAKDREPLVITLTRMRDIGRDFEKAARRLEHLQKPSVAPDQHRRFDGALPSGGRSAPREGWSRPVADEPGYSQLRVGRKLYSPGAGSA